MHRRALLIAPLVLAATPALAAGGGGGGAAAPADTWIRYPTVTGMVMRGDGSRGVLTVDAGVDVADPALNLRARQSQPRIRAVFNILVQREANVLLPGRVPNVERLAAQLQSATNIILGQRGAKLLLGSVVVS
ncbi:MAG: Tat pathway signal protein [Brevundimonas sp.]|uniref:Tat pathway signal protein n=1 Tax=Brevundimonas sp. TaxID=1871086 RepID=UPI0027332A60|nr:Tat pathway signal protein [Brevundimonas sp.]MDP3404995.1 Tat pathway signal protein [Brevundimonas sp.]